MKSKTSRRKLKKKEVKKIKKLHTTPNFT